MRDHNHLLTELNKAFALKYHSTAQYLAEVRPYVPEGRESCLEALGAVADADREQARALAEVIEALGGVPQAATHDASLTSRTDKTMILSDGKIIDIRNAK